MTVTFFINYLNHHQVHLADELYKLLGDGFRYVATCTGDPKQLKGGSDYSNRPYCLHPTENNDDMIVAHELNLNSDVCVYGAGNLDWESERATTDKLSFEISERWFKRGSINLLSPRLIKWLWLYHRKLHKKPFYKLCASAYTAPDSNKLGAFRDRCYKWGYFTEVTPMDITTDNDARRKSPVVRILWTGRFLNWKHPEKMLQLASYLRNKGVDNFEITMIGTGTEYDRIQQQITKRGLSSHIKLLGKIPNEKVISKMREHDIFCFTSDRNEGWGAVLNEAMSNGCCVVANDEIGSVPYLIKNGINGMIYRDGKAAELINSVKKLLSNPSLRLEMGKMAYMDMQRCWNPATAAHNLIALSQSLMQGLETPFSEGPCSKA